MSPAAANPPGSVREGKLSLKMKRLLAPALTPAMVGVNVARHVAWYISYQMTGNSTRV